MAKVLIICVRDSVLLAKVEFAGACISNWRCTGNSDRTPFASWILCRTILNERATDVL